MKITVFGAGATGGNFAVHLAQSGHEVSAVARGPHLEAIRKNGLTLIEGETTRTSRLAAAADPRGFGTQDVVYIGVKATGLAGIADVIRPLVGSETLVVFPQNGIPWWYPIGLKDKPTPPDLPQFRLAEAFLPFIAPDRIVGGVIYSGNEVVEPGIVRNTTPNLNQLHLGSLDGVDAPALNSLRDACEAAGITSPHCSDIRHITWRKLLVNICGSGLSVVLRNHLAAVHRDPALAETYRRIIAEGLAIAASAGYDLSREITADMLIASAGGHYPSMLQDYMAGRPMEIEEILLSPQAFARKAGLQTPVSATIATLARRIGEDAGLFAPEGRETKAATS